ncbi:MAG: Rrf2 family transcriptional regulator [Halanaerobium sp.]|nr:Rrf2 family transcriptional regulator [Halanaerobium sp.]
MVQISPLHREILFQLRENDASYAEPVTSEELGMILKVTPSYIRDQIQALVRMEMVGVRKGRGGGYYLPSELNFQVKSG